MTNRSRQYRNKELARETKQEQNRRYYWATGSFTAPNRYQQWSLEHDRMVAAHSFPDRVLAERIGRSVKAIQIRRGRLARSIPASA